MSEQEAAKATQEMADLLRENANLKRILNCDPEILDLAVRPGRIAVTERHPIVPLFGQTIYNLLKDYEAENYVEIVMLGPDGQKYAVTGQRCLGLTPGEKVTRMRADILALAERLDQPMTGMGNGDVAKRLREIVGKGASGE